MNDDLIISEYLVTGYDQDGPGGPRICRHTSPFYDGVKWAVRWRGRCIGKTGDWEFEPQPSSRDDEFYARCRFDSVEAALATLLTSSDTQIGVGPRRTK